LCSTGCAKKLTAGQNSTELSAKNYSANVAQLARENPNVRAAYDSGYIARDDYHLLGILIPEIGGEIARKYGFEPQLVANLTSSVIRQYRAEPGRQEIRKYDYVPDAIRKRIS
jgi:hypothetical protein